MTLRWCARLLLLSSLHKEETCWKFVILRPRFTQLSHTCLSEGSCRSLRRWILISTSAQPSESASNIKRFLISFVRSDKRSLRNCYDGKGVWFSTCLNLAFTRWLSLRISRSCVQIFDTTFNTGSWCLIQHIDKYTYDSYFFRDQGQYVNGSIKSCLLQRQKIYPGIQPIFPH